MLFNLFKPDVEKMKAGKDVKGLIKAFGYVGWIKSGGHKIKDYNVIYASRKALVEIGAPAVEQLIAALNDENANVRSNAAGVLGKIGDARAVAPLVTALKGADSIMRGCAAEALGEIGDTNAVEPLILALKDKDNKVRGLAAEALGEMGGAQAVEPLISALKDLYGSVRDSAVLALRKSRDARAVEPLIQMLKDPDKGVRDNTYQVLQLFNDPRAKQAVAEKRKELEKTRSEKKDNFAVFRGGFGEPYCSQACYDKGGQYISAVMMKNQTGVCGICKKPVQASMYGTPNCAVVPYEGVNLFVCTSCTGEGKTHLSAYKKCCMCQKML